MKNYYNKNFEIIKNSESYANYDEPDPTAAHEWRVMNNDKARSDRVIS